MIQQIFRIPETSQKNERNSTQKKPTEYLKIMDIRFGNCSYSSNRYVLE